MATKGLLFMRLPQAVRETHALERKSSSSLMKLQSPSTQLCRNQEVAKNPIRLLASRSLCAKIPLKERFQPALNSPCSTKAARCWRVWKSGCNLIFLQALASGSEKTIPSRLTTHCGRKAEALTSLALSSPLFHLQTGGRVCLFLRCVVCMGACEALLCQLSINTFSKNYTIIFQKGKVSFSSCLLKLWGIWISPWKS